MLHLFTNASWDTESWLLQGASGATAAMWARDREPACSPSPWRSPFVARFKGTRPFRMQNLGASESLHGLARSQPWERPRGRRNPSTPCFFHACGLLHGRCRGFLAFVGLQCAVCTCGTRRGPATPRQEATGAAKTVRSLGTPSRAPNYHERA